jgi:hypothetical protein
MKTLSGIMSNQSKQEYLESARARYPSRNRLGKGKMISELCDTFGWTRKHTIKALNGKVSHGKTAKKRGRKATYGDLEKSVIVNIWKSSEQPCGILLKSTIPLWLDSYETHNSKIPPSSRSKILRCSPRQLDRITKPYKLESASRYGRKTGRTSHRLKTQIPVQCGPQEVDRPGWFEADTVAHGGGSSSGAFMWSLTLTDLHTGWTELYGLWGNSGNEVCVGLRRIESRMPMDLLGFDCDNGSEFLNETLESYLISEARKVKWTRSRPYKKNDQAHVEQKNFTHVRQLLGYGRYDKIELVSMVNDLYETAWLPLRNYFTPAMKLVEKIRTGSKVKKTYDTAKTPCDRMLDCPLVTPETKALLRKTRATLDPYQLAQSIETKLKAIFEIIHAIESQRAEEEQWLNEESADPTGGRSTVFEEFSASSVAIAPFVSENSSKTEKLANLH